jgi:hypothetical protein
MVEPTRNRDGGILDSSYRQNNIPIFERAPHGAFHWRTP